MERRDADDLKRPFMANRFLHINSSGHVSSSNPNFYRQNYSTETYPNFLAHTPSPLSDLEDSFSRMNLNVSSNNNHPLIFTGADSNDQLERMRVESAVRGQMGLYNMNLVASNFGGVVRSSSSRGSDFENFGFNIQRRSQSFDELAYAYPRRLIKNSDILQGRRSSTWAVNGLASQCTSSSSSFSSANSLSSMYNHHVLYPQQRTSKYSSLAELKGKISSMIKDQNGCRHLQKIIFDPDKRDSEVIEVVFSEVKDRLHEYMVHQFANYFMQRLFEVCNQEQRKELLLLLVSSEQRLVHVCTDSHGTRAVQKFLERISNREQISIFLSLLKPIAITLTNNIHGHHIIEQCLIKFSKEDTKQLVDEIVEHCLQIATDKSGCCVLQLCLAHAQAEAKERLLSDIAANAFVLSEHAFGNYVVQYVLEMKIPHVTSNVIANLGGTFVTLSMNKFGSNVVEKCLKEAGEDDSARIITEIMTDPEFLKVLQDPFGNYVVQSALNIAKGNLRNTLVEFIQHNQQSLHSHLYGKKVLARTKCRKTRVQLANVVTLL